MKSDGICQGCREKLPYIEGSRCMKCGKAVDNDDIEYCYDCYKNHHIYDAGIALFSYSEEIKKSIYQFKYHNKREYGGFYGKEISEKLGKRIKMWNPEAIVPVPLHKSRLIKRGFNQAEVLAQNIGKNLDIPVRNDIIVRCEKTRPQKELTDRDRRKNVENAFKINKNIVELKRLILVDDIYTTGSTIDACADVLKRSGVQEVYYVSLSIGTGF